jgi:hydroxypyruvate isomerase
MQLTEGRLADTITRHIRRIKHLQIAGVPGRNEPNRGEINYSYLFDLIDRLEFKGWVGCEYRPFGETLAGLGWATAYGIGSH